MGDKPFSQACENNKEPIRAVLERWLGSVDTLLEVGSGTGQHAVYFAEQFPHMTWQTSDLPANHAGIEAWRASRPAENLKAPIALDVNDENWGCGKVSAIYTANTCHIMSADSVAALFRGVNRHLNVGGLVFIYGPFNYGGKFTSDSNRQFDAHLRARDSASGIRDFEYLADLADDVQLRLVEDNEMPANNRLLIFRRDAASDG